MTTNIPDNLNIGGADNDSLVDKVFSKLWLHYRNKMDRYIIFKKERWSLFGLLLTSYIIRVLYQGGFYVISYILGLYILQATIKFLTPLGLPDIEEEEEDEEKVIGELPLYNQPQGESKPVLIRSISEFKFWQGVTGATILSHLLISFEVFDLPVYWPFLFGYFLFLVALTAKKHLRHMQKYGYSFSDFGRKTKS